MIAREDVPLIVGVGLVAGGAWMAWPPLGPIVVGVAVLAVWWHASVLNRDEESDS